MVEMEKEGVEAWNDRVDEVIGGGECWTKEESDAYNATHPIPSEEEIDRIIREATE